MVIDAGPCCAFCPARRCRWMIVASERARRAMPEQHAHAYLCAIYRARLCLRARLHNQQHHRKVCYSVRLHVHVYIRCKYHGHGRACHCARRVHANRARSINSDLDLTGALCASPSACMCCICCNADGVNGYYMSTKHIHLVC